MNAAAMIVSKNRLEGSLADTPLRGLLDACHKHLVTGAIKVFDEKGRRHGVLLLRAGFVDQARFGDSVGDAAVETMLALKEGMYELAQQLPDLSGELGRAAALEGAVDQVSVVQIMRHCEHNALSAVITIINDFDRGEIHYRAGEVETVTLNGEADDDAIVTMLGWAKARYRVSAPPLASEIGGWPTVGREQTQPFKVDEAMLPPKMQAARKRHDAKLAQLPRAASRADEGFAKDAATEGAKDAPLVIEAKAEAKTEAEAPTKPRTATKAEAKAARKAEAKAGKRASAAIATATVTPAETVAKAPAEAPKAEALTPAPTKKRSTLARTLVQAFLLTLAATLVLTLVALLASR